MPKSKSDSKKIHSRFLIVIIVLIALFVTLVVVFSLFQNYEKNRSVQLQKDTLNQSLIEVENVFNKFEKNINYSKEYERISSNTCRLRGSKGIAEYACGNNARIVVSQIDEKQYYELYEKSVNLVESNEYFKKMTSYQPVLLKSSNKLVSSSGLQTNNGIVNCFLSSEYEVTKREASFRIGCNVTAREMLFPLDG